MSSTNATANMIDHLQNTQEKPTNDGTKAADVPDNFLAGKHNANPLNIFGAFATTMTAKRLSIQSVAPSASVWLCFGVCRSPILEVRESGFVPIESPSTIFNISQHKVLFYLSPFARNSNVKLCPPPQKKIPHVLGV